MKKEDTRKKPAEIISIIIDVILYVSIIAILVFWQLFPTVFSDISIQLVLISILILFGACWVSVIKNIANVKKLFQNIDTTDVMKYGFLSNHIDEISKKHNHIKSLKIMDASAEDFLHFFSTNNVVIDNCTLLVREYKEEDFDYSSKAQNQVNESIKRWEKYNSEGKIKNLTIAKYNNSIPDFFCIIDSRMTLSGFITDIPLRENPNVLYVDITSRKGYQLIQQYAKEFDFLFDAYKKRMGLNLDKGNVLAYQNVSDDRAKEQLKSALRKTQNIYAVGLACTEMSTLSSEDLTTILVNNKANIQLLYLYPDGESIKERERMENGNDIKEYTFGSIVKYNKSRLQNGINEVIKNNNSEEITRQVEIGYYDFLPTINCIITDEYAFVHYYGMKNCGMDSPTFIIKKSSDPAIYEFYKRNFDEHWKLKMKE